MTATTIVAATVTWRETTDRGITVLHGGTTTIAGTMTSVTVTGTAIAGRGGKTKTTTTITRTATAIGTASPWPSRAPRFERKSISDKLFEIFCDLRVVFQSTKAKTAVHLLAIYLHLLAGRLRFSAGAIQAFAAIFWGSGISGILCQESIQRSIRCPYESTVAWLSVLQPTTSLVYQRVLTSVPIN